MNLNQKQRLELIKLRNRHSRSALPGAVHDIDLASESRTGFNFKKFAVFSGIGVLLGVLLISSIGLYDYINNRNNDIASVEKVLANEGVLVRTKLEPVDQSKMNKLVIGEEVSGAWPGTVLYSAEVGEDVKAVATFVDSNVLNDELKSDINEVLNGQYDDSVLTAVFSVDGPKLGESVSHGEDSPLMTDIVASTFGVNSESAEYLVTDDGVDYSLYLVVKTESKLVLIEQKLSEKIVEGYVVDEKCDLECIKENYKDRGYSQGIVSLLDKMLSTFRIV